MKQKDPIALNHRRCSEDPFARVGFYVLILERMMAKAAQSSVLVSTPAVSADQSTRIQFASDIFMTVMIFSLSGLLISLGALALGWPLAWD